MYANLEGKETKAEPIRLAPRPTTLQGKTVALYHNDKIASFPVMRTIRKQLETFGVKEIFEVHSKTPWSRHPDHAIVEALKADVVFAGTCD
ncbi:MAG: hypothetical protein V1915_03730 [Candidatus Bathyarchaeota archaeon]